jgi:hypothetical protein
VASLRFLRMPSINTSPRPFPSRLLEHGEAVTSNAADHGAVFTGCSGRGRPCPTHTFAREAAMKLQAPAFLPPRPLLPVARATALLIRAPVCALGGAQPEQQPPPLPPPSTPAARELSRRKFLAAVLTAAVAAGVPASHAISGLQEFPLRNPLTNNYWFLRAGESISEARKEVRTNPVEKTSIQLHGLTSRGIEQALVAASRLEQQGVGSLTWLWSSQQQACQETAELVAYELGIRREQVRLQILDTLVSSRAAFFLAWWHIMGHRSQSR